MAVTQPRAERCAPCRRDASLLAAAFRVLQEGRAFSATEIAGEAQVSPSLVKHYLYPMGDLRRRLVAEAIASGDARKLAPLLTWPESKAAPVKLRRAAALELIR